MTVHRVGGAGGGHKVEVKLRLDDGANAFTLR